MKSIRSKLLFTLSVSAIFVFGLVSNVSAEECIINKKEFYFIRHGQTDYNAGVISADKECPLDIPLNERGREQAYAAEKIISSLPVTLICYSPLTRAQETKNIVCANLRVAQYEIVDLSESCLAVWNEMNLLGAESYEKGAELTRQFMDQVARGLNQVLSHDGPALIVGHSGFYRALCNLLKIKQDWFIDNCAVAHFSLDENNVWKVEIVTDQRDKKERDHNDERFYI